jgi:hypothetical protein
MCAVLKNADLIYLEYAVDCMCNEAASSAINVTPSSGKRLFNVNVVEPAQTALNKCPLAFIDVLTTQANPAHHRLLKINNAGSAGSIRFSCRKYMLLGTS